MKIKFEIRLTASRALLAVLAAMVGMSANADEKEQELPAGFGEAPSLPVEQLQSQQPVQAPEKPKATRTRTAAPKPDPIPEKIVPPPTLTAEEAIGQEEQGRVPETTAPATPAITIEEVRGFGGSLIQKDDVKYRPLVMATLQAHGASKFSELDPSEYASTLADLKLL